VPHRDRMRTQLLPCPQCDGVAEVDWQARRHSNSRSRAGHLVKIRCIRRHWFLMPSDQLDWYPGDSGHGSDGTERAAA
jgi:hypothetical protein